MKCKKKINLRDLLQRIIRQLIQRNLNIIEDQLNQLGTYDIAIWEGLTRGFVRSMNLIRLGTKLLKKNSFAQQAQRVLLRYFEKCLEIADRGENPNQKARALAKLARAGIFLPYPGVGDIFRKATDEIYNISDILDRIRAGSYILFEISRIYYFRERKKDEIVIGDDDLKIIENLGRRIYEEILTWIDLIPDVAEKAKSLVILSESIRDFTTIVSSNEKRVQWIDTNEAEILANESLKASEILDDPYEKGIIKAYVGYLYGSLAPDLRESSQMLINQALEIAFSLARENLKLAGKLLGEIAYIKALMGNEDEAEVLFNEACLLTLKCPEIENVLVALNIAELSGKARLVRVTGELLEDYILPIIHSINDDVRHIALKAIASDVAAWVDSGWGARLAESASEEIWSLDPLDVFDGEQVYLLALGAAKSAFASPSASWRILDFIISGLRSDLWANTLFIKAITFEWFGKALGALKDIPYLYNTLRDEFIAYFTKIKTSSNQRFIPVALAEFASGLANADVTLSQTLLEEAIKGAQGTNLETYVFAKAIMIAEKISSALNEHYLSEILKVAENKLSLDETVDYLNDILRTLIKSRSRSKRKIAKFIVDIITDSKESEITNSKAVKRFIKILRKIDSSWANEIDAMVREVRRENSPRKYKTECFKRYREKEI